MGLVTSAIFSKSSRGPLADSFCQGALIRSSSRAQASVFCLSLSWKLSWSALTSAGAVSCASYPVSFGKSGVGDISSGGVARSGILLKSSSSEPSLGGGYTGDFGWYL